MLVANFDSQGFLCVVTEDVTDPVPQHAVPFVRFIAHGTFIRLE
jgi:hypothetical protein